MLCVMHLLKMMFIMQLVKAALAQTRRPQRRRGDRWDATGYGAPTLQVVDQENGCELRLALVDPHTGRAVPRERVRYRPGPGADDTVRALLDNLKQGAGA